ncbi:MAG: HesA/MoeB/ThiF family protein [Maribacter sp.]|nr:HesA/MoeB/ThiF family protein [Maribacter sp.]
MNLERYKRQTILKDFGPECQLKLAQSKVLVVGAGGLGIPVLTYLNAMGVGTLGIVDIDEVSISNLHRQVLYNENDIGQSKVTVAIKKLQKQNSDTNLIALKTFLIRDNALDIIKDYDLVVDASDNFPTRYLINDACVILKKPFVYGALHSFEGQVSVFNYLGGPTYRCLFPNMPSANELPDCNEHGVLGITPGIVGNLQALETVKVLTGIGEVLSGKLLLFNGLNQSFQKIKFSPIPANLNITMLQMDYALDCSKDTVSIEAWEFEKLWHSEMVQIIDVRTLKEYEQFHLRDSICHPLDDIENWRHQISLSSPVYLICQSGIRSLKAQQYLQSNNPEANFINVNGGINKLKIYATEH